MRAEGVIAIIALVVATAALALACLALFLEWEDPMGSFNHGNPNINVNVSGGSGGCSGGCCGGLCPAPKPVCYESYCH
jgi:hypothetical protein